jgi:hypothetical protein
MAPESSNFLAVAPARWSRGSDYDIVGTWAGWNGDAGKLTASIRREIGVTYVEAVSVLAFSRAWQAVVALAADLAVRDEMGGLEIQSVISAAWDCHQHV